MKKIFLSIAIASSLYAEEHNFVELGVIYTNTKDNFSTDSKKEIYSYNNSKHEDSISPNINFYYGKNISENYHIYLESIYQEINLGNIYYTEYGNFYFGAKTKLFEDEWENPFELNRSRKKTDVNQYGGFFAYEFLSSDFSSSLIKYEYDKRDYDKDLLVNELKREANIHSLSLENFINFDFLDEDTTIFTNLKAKKYDAIGKASSYNTFGIDIGFSTNITNKYNVMLLTNFSQKRYDEKNPILNEKIHSDIVSFFARSEYKEPFNFKNTFLSLTIGYEDENTNNSFYDNQTSFAIFGIGYSF
ncbi:DUF2860 family protein [Aliarcobacter vitoriensis]|uniref:DUF2860 domain-containing protein n=1 Tax=Aliarcobacter vitoriensis TaxID=2011099 RepID=A0A366MV93_9BACT|nr:DUF2860 family protein [Aliarcobacter vitoriensis]RBQ29409.1 hypothetical protein CRU91_04815 [Aliarcobacter vitoriensis]